MSDNYSSQGSEVMVNLGSTLPTNVHDAFKILERIKEAERIVKSRKESVQDYLEKTIEENGEGEVDEKGNYSVSFDGVTMSLSKRKSTSWAKVAKQVKAEFLHEDEAKGRFESIVDENTSESVSKKFSEED